MLYKVGLCQFKPSFLDVESNLKKMKEMIKDIEADLIVFPELATSGYIFKSFDELKKVSEPYNGKTYEMFKEISKITRTSFVIGFPEIFEGKYYNSSILVNPNGTVHVYRKTHLFYEEKKWFEPGNTGFNVFEAKGGVKVGLMICFDWIFPESARTLAVKGAQIIAHSANLVLPWCQQAMITRSIENRVFTITCNRTGLEKNGDSELIFTGQSQITDTRGNIYKRLTEDEESVFVTEIDPGMAENKDVNEYNNILNDRRMGFYL